MSPAQWCHRLGTRVPLVQAPVGGASNPLLVAAVANAGAFGFLSGTWRDPTSLEAMVREIQSATTGTFGVNFVLEWDMRERVERCLDVGVRHFGFFWGDPTPFVAAIHSAGGMVWSTVGSAEEAEVALAGGVDVLMAQGWEAGGHVRGTMALSTLVPEIVDRSGDVPVVAAGGITDGRGLAAALCLGASAGCAGTAFLVAEEASTHGAYRERLIAARGGDAVHTTIFDGGWPDAPHRVLRNRTWDTWLASGSPPSGARPGEGDVLGVDPEGDPVFRYTSHLPRPGGVGEVVEQALYSGQGVGRVLGVRTAAEIVAAFDREAREALGRLDWPGSIG
ncbi:MAG: NAD(P)H-dependent flavin oxidoreductase [Armatimonadota bacterium]